MVVVLNLVGALAIATSSYLHFRLWDGFGYRNIPTVGKLFIVQVVVGAALALAVVVLRRVGCALAGAGFAAATAAGFLISVTHGLFGFRDTWAAPFASVAFVLEVVGVVTLCLVVVLSTRGTAAR